MEYRNINENYWKEGRYDAPNIESWVFRIPSRYFEKYGIRNQKLKILDFGCGQGSTLQFFKKQGCDVYGVDISREDINVCKSKMPEIKDHFKLINSEPDESDCFFGGNFDLIISVQVLYYYDDMDLEKRLKSLYNMLKPGSYVFFTMMGIKNGYFNYAEADKNGLWKVDMNISPTSYKMRQKSHHGKNTFPHYIAFTKDEEDLKQKFHFFEPLEIGFYDFIFFEEEGSGHHFMFWGKKIS